MTDKRRKICRALINCLQHKPYESISIKDIALEAELPAGSIYYYYPKKEDILFNAFSMLSDWYVNGLSEAVSLINEPCRQQLSIKERIIAVCHFYAQVALERDIESNSQPYFFFYTHAHYDESLYQMLVQNRERCLDVVREKLRPFAKNEQSLCDFTQAFRCLNIGAVTETRIHLDLKQAYRIYDQFLESMIPVFFYTD